MLARYYRLLLAKNHLTRPFGGRLRRSVTLPCQRHRRLGAGSDVYAARY
jgi:hypothetical protein